MQIQISLPGTIRYTVLRAVKIVYHEDLVCCAKNLFFRVCCTSVRVFQYTISTLLVNFLTAAYQEMSDRDLIIQWEPLFYISVTNSIPDIIRYSVLRTGILVVLCRPFNSALRDSYRAC